MPEPLRLLIHAPTAAALARARSNARNLLAAAPEAEVEILANAEAAMAALETPDRATDPLLLVCANSLRARNAPLPDHLRRVEAAVLHAARRQAQGWGYWRA